MLFYSTQNSQGPLFLVLPWQLSEGEKIKPLLESTSVSGFLRQIWYKQVRWSRREKLDFKANSTARWVCVDEGSREPDGRSKQWKLVYETRRTGTKGINLFCVDVEESTEDLRPASSGNGCSLTLGLLQRWEWTHSLKRSKILQIGERIMEKG